MDAAFGTETQRYSVFIQDNTPYTVGDYQVNPMGEKGCNFVSLPKGLNLINPTWSYLVIKNQYNYTANFIYVNDLGQGSGVT